MTFAHRDDLSIVSHLTLNLKTQQYSIAPVKTFRIIIILLNMRMDNIYLGKNYAQIFANLLFRINFCKQSPSGSEDDVQFRKSKDAVSDVLAAKLRSKYPNEFTVKRVAVENRNSIINRARFLERNKIATKVKIDNLQKIFEI